MQPTLNKKFFWFLLVPALLLFTVGGRLEASEPGRPLRIVCTILPVYCFTLNVTAGVPGLQIELLLPPSQGCSQGLRVALQT